MNELETRIPRHPRLAAAIGYAAVVLVLSHRAFHGEVLSPAANLWAQPPFHSMLRDNLSPHLNGMQADVWREFEPAHRYQHESARHGRFPLWNPHIFCGAPFHASGQAAVLSPFHWPYFVLDPMIAAGWVAALKWWVAGFGTFCLARHLGMSWGGAFVAGMAWMLSAFNVRWLQWNHSAAAAWLPLVIWSSDRLLEGLSLRRIAVAGLCAGALQLSGHPQTQFHAGVLAGLFVLVRLAYRSDVLWVRLARAGACVMAQLLGLALAAAWMWPFAQAMVRSADWQHSTHVARHAVPLEALWGWVAPDHWGRPRAERFYQGPLNYNEAGMYIGIVPLALAIIALFRLLPNRDRERAGPVVVAGAVWIVLCGLIVFGVPGTSVLLDWLPLTSKANNMRLVMGLQLAGALLAGVGWTELSRYHGRRVPWRFVLVPLAICAALGYLLFGPAASGLYRHTEGLQLLWTDPQVPSPLEHRSLRTLVCFVIGLGAVLGVVRQGGRRAWLMALVCLDLMWAAYGFNPWVPPRVARPDTPDALRVVLDRAGRDRIVATGEILLPNLAMDYGLRDLRGYDFPLDVRLHSLFYRLRWDSLNPLLPEHQVFPCLAPAVQSVCDKSAVRLLVSSRPRGARLDPLTMCDAQDGTSRPEWPVVYRSGAGADVVFENPTAYPRAYLARRALTANSEAALDALLDGTHDLRVQSFVEQAVPESLGSDAELEQAEVEIVDDEPESVQLQVRASRPALLVLSDHYDADWVVRIDGAAAQALRTNYLFRGVIVPPGEHRVSWTYEPRSFRAGCVVSGVTILCLFCAACVPSRRSHPGGPLKNSG